MLMRTNNFYVPCLWIQSHVACANLVLQASCFGLSTFPYRARLLPPLGAVKLRFEVTSVAVIGIACMRSVSRDYGVKLETRTHVGHVSFLLQGPSVSRRSGIVQGRLFVIFAGLKHQVRTAFTYTQLDKYNCQGQ